MIGIRGADARLGPDCSEDSKAARPGFHALLTTDTEDATPRSGVLPTMPPLITDIELLALEPTLFTDAKSQGVMLDDRTNAAISGTTLTSVDSDFTAIGINDRRVAVVDGEPLEIVSLIDSTNAQVSLPRPKSATVIEPKAGTGLTMQIITFEKHIDAAEVVFRRALGLLPDDPVEPVEDTQVLNLDELTPLVALIVAADVFTRAAAASDPEDDSLVRRATAYDALRADALRTAAAMLDLDDDGITDATRRLGAVTWRRV